MFLKMKSTLLLSALLLSACASENIDARKGGIRLNDADLRREDVKDYMTYLRLKKGASPLDQDYILLSYRVMGDMVRSELLSQKSERIKIALRDVLNYNSDAQIRPAIVHEEIERELMNTESVWVVDGSVLYDYVLDVELNEIPLKNDSQAEEKALSVLFVLSDVKGKEAGEWFGFLKREKGGLSWY